MRFVDLDFDQFVSVHINAKIYIKNNHKRKTEKKNLSNTQAILTLHLLDTVCFVLRVLQEHLQFAVQKAKMKSTAVTEVTHQPDGKAKKEMVRSAGQEQSFSVLNKEEVLNRVSDRRTASLEQSSFNC